MNHPVLWLFTKKKEEEKGNESFCLRAFEWEPIISAVYVSKGKRLMK